MNSAKEKFSARVNDKQVISIGRPPMTDEVEWAQYISATLEHLLHARAATGRAQTPLTVAAISIGRAP